MTSDLDFIFSLALRGRATNSRVRYTEIYGAVRRSRDTRDVPRDTFEMLDIEIVKGKKLRGKFESLIILIRRGVENTCPIFYSISYLPHHVFAGDSIRA